MSISVNIISAGYGKKTILKNISFSADDGTFTAVIGRNGCGKSTLVSAIASLLPYQGKIELDGLDTSTLERRDAAKHISVMFQSHTKPHITVRELVEFGRDPYRQGFAGLSENDEQIIQRAIHDADLETISDSYIDRISGGEVRRAYLGMILSQNTKNLLFDEATAFMDIDHEHRFTKMIHSLVRDKGRTVISVMHNLELAIRFADNILLLDNGMQLFFGKTEDILETDMIENTFGISSYKISGKIFFSAK